MPPSLLNHPARGSVEEELELSSWVWKTVEVSKRSTQTIALEMEHFADEDCLWSFSGTAADFLLKQQAEVWSLGREASRPSRDVG
jgi:chaperone required for assembly of F1-ATPase